MITKPNILWIMSDQHAAHALGCYGNTDVRTPNLDTLAAKGIVFKNAYCNNPICAPSRACFMSGQYIHTHGIAGNQVQDYNATHPLTIAEHFQNAGYQTALIGKGHLPISWIERGFKHQRLADMADADPDNPLSIHYFAHLVEEGLADDFDLGTLYPPHPGASMKGFISPLPFEHSTERWTGNEALNFLENHRDTTDPFFLKISFQRPHDPYSPSAEQAELYDPESLTLPSNASDLFENHFEGKPGYQREYIKKKTGSGYPYRPYDPADLRRQLAYYYTLITVIDTEIGRIIDHLKETGEYDNTIIVYHADHGDFAGEHGLMLKNFGVYESIHRIPWIMRIPDGPEDRTYNELIESVDLYPTLCEAANLAVPKNLDGASLIPVIERNTSGKEQVCVEWDFPQSEMARVLSVRTKTHRLVYYPENPSDGELYKHENDAGELHNLYHDPACALVRLQLTECLLQHVSGFHRNIDFKTETHPTGPSVQIHKGGKQWSQLYPGLSSNVTDKLQHDFNPSSI